MTTIQETMLEGPQGVVRCESCDGWVNAMDADRPRYECQTCGTEGEERQCDQCHKFRSRAGILCPECDGMLTEDAAVEATAHLYRCHGCDHWVEAPDVPDHFDGHQEDRWTKLAPPWARRERDLMTDRLKVLDERLAALEAQATQAAQEGPFRIVDYAAPRYERPLGDAATIVRVHLEEGNAMEVKLADRDQPSLEVRWTGPGGLAVYPAGANVIRVQGLGVWGKRS